jgi:predicted AlkP superfamily phosphohydrolase/phosphomutase
MTKVLVLGFDGAPFDTIEKLTKTNDLPNFERFLREGCGGPLLSVTPPVTFNSWPVIFTGLNPGELGIFDWFALKKGTYSGEPNNSDVVKGKAVWDFLSRINKRTTVVNVPMTYPPYEINGLMVAGFPAPVNGLTTWPPPYAEVLKAEIGNYEIDIEPSFEQLQEKFLEEVNRVTDMHMRAILRLLAVPDWDFFVGVITGLDRLQHVFYEMDDAACRLVLSDYYQKLDSFVGTAVGSVPEETTVILISDHGFETVKKTFGVNNWLAKHGYAETSKFGLEDASLIVRRLGLYGLAQKIVVRDMTYIQLLKLVSAMPSKVKFSRSRAFCRFHASNIYINRDIVSDDAEREATRDKMIQELEKTVDPEDGSRIVDHVFKREELYSGRLADRAPDLVLVLNQGYEPVRWANDVIEIRKTPQKSFCVKRGTHQSMSAHRGIFLAMGKQVRTRQVLDGISAYDVAPTLLQIFGMPKPPEMHGNALNAIFTTTEPTTTAHVGASETESKFEYTEEERASIEKHLRDLGYV